MIKSAFNSIIAIAIQVFVLVCSTYSYGQFRHTTFDAKSSKLSSIDYSKYQLTIRIWLSYYNYTKSKEIHLRTKSYQFSVFKDSLDIHDANLRWGLVKGKTCIDVFLNENYLEIAFCKGWKLKDISKELEEINLSTESDLVDKYKTSYSLKEYKKLSQEYGKTLICSRYPSYESTFNHMKSYSGSCQFDVNWIDLALNKELSSHTNNKNTKTSSKRLIKDQNSINSPKNKIQTTKPKLPSIF